MDGNEILKVDTVSRVGGAMKGTDLVFVDLETTGLDCKIHEIIEIALIRVTQDWSSGETPTFTVREEWSKKIFPENLKTADPASLRVNGYTVTGWKDAVRLEEALREFSEKTAGAIMVAHNVAFDAGFLDSAFSAFGIQNKMHYHRLDTVSMAYAKLHSTPLVTRFSLAELCKHFGIVNENAHSALADTKADFELFKKLMQL
ncbi:MAG: 3'-5' exonuclease [Candidatus Pacebacteria bacterium]|nr:3'-5' exonuclease [Candidatus Paceibacterota bacterium]